MGNQEELLLPVLNLIVQIPLVLALSVLWYTFIFTPFGVQEYVRTSLFKNYLSEFTFVDYVIFMGGVPDTFRIDSSQNLFNATNVKEKALISVREGLVEESNKKEYIDNSYITDKNIDNFLKVVWFVVDDKLPQDYIKEITPGDGTAYVRKKTDYNQEKFFTV